ncbi:MAG TPA: GNAT family N-acetyltransferase [Pyrinomonadaceae bacterium]|jgi:GNAT superfamily N-acetyltransferase|nr:GNAT family N-acetyltransferase [Pyrinomonadaceae bacterium]
MSGDIQIKQFELAEQEALLTFLREAYPEDPRKSERAYWEWHYLENPHTRPDDIPLWIVKSGERIVGQAATLPVELKLGDERRRAIWILDFIVGANYRGKGLGKRLVAAARQKYPTMFALGFNEQSEAVLRRLDWVMMGRISRYHRLLFPGDALGRVLSPVRKALNLGFAPLRPRPPARSRLKENHTLRAVTAFDAAFDALWREASVEWPCAVVREARFLEWQFMRQPGKRFDVLGLYTGEQLLGYVVLFFRKPERSGGPPPKAAISDLCYRADASVDVVEELLRAALALALERRAGSLVIDVLDPRVEQWLKRLGFWRIQNSPQFMTYVPDRQDLMYEMSNWFLTRADSDVSIFEQPNL